MHCAHSRYCALHALCTHKALNSTCTVHTSGAEPYMYRVHSRHCTVVGFLPTCTPYVVSQGYLLTESGFEYLLYAYTLEHHSHLTGLTILQMKTLSL